MEGEATNIRLAMRSTNVVFKTAKEIYRTDGLISLIRRGFAFVASCFFKYDTYHLYVEYYRENMKFNEAEWMPKIRDFTFKRARTNREADELEAQGFEFRSYFDNARERLDKGAIASCVFVGGELAHIGWSATTQEAKDSLGEQPYRVDFSNNEACGETIWTNPRYRRMGFSRYGFMKKVEFMVDNGILVNRYAVGKRNIRSRKFVNSLDASIYGEGRYLRILWWKSWKERALTPDSGKEQSNAID